MSNYAHGEKYHIDDDILFMVDDDALMLVEKDYLRHGAVPVSSPEWRHSPREECVRYHPNSPGGRKYYDSLVSKNFLTHLVL